MHFIFYSKTISKLIFPCNTSQHDEGTQKSKSEKLKKLHTLFFLIPVGNLLCAGKHTLKSNWAASPTELRANLFNATSPPCHVKTFEFGLHSLTALKVPDVAHTDVLQSLRCFKINEWKEQFMLTHRRATLCKVLTIYGRPKVKKKIKKNTGVLVLQVLIIYVCL